MEESEDLSLTQFKIVFNNETLQINYDTSFKEYKTQTIDSVIQQALNKIGPKPLEKTSKDYTLYCSCGRPFNPNKLLCQAKCAHNFESDFNKEKNKNEKYILIENEKEEKYDKYISNYEISSILMKVTGATKLKKIKGVVPNEDSEHLLISEDLKNKIKEYYTKKERGKKILDHSFSLKYSQQLYNELLEFGIPNNKIKAALRMSNNIKEEALLMATDETFNWENRDYLYYENNEVLSNAEFNRLCKEEIKKEFPSIKDEEEISNRTTTIINLVIKKNQANNNINSDDINEDESSEEEIESSSDDIVLDSDSNLGSSSFNI